jgi:RNA polymerase sigma factor for flagellar operon FliA
MAQPSSALPATGIRRGVGELVEENLALVGHLVREVMEKVPTSVCRDDLTSAGMVSLVVSAQAFRPDSGVHFARFAAPRIRRALLDELRGMDLAARSVAGPCREVESVRAQLSATLGHPARPRDVAGALGMTVAELSALELALDQDAVLSLNAFTPGGAAELLAGPSSDPEALLLQREKLGYLRDAIADLPGRLRYLVTSYFFRQCPLSEIAAELGVSESRLRQMRAEALRLLRRGMNAQLDPSTPLQPAFSARPPATRPAYVAAGTPIVAMPFSRSAPGRIA